MASNTAIFYDIENLMGVFAGKTNTGLHLDEIYRKVLELDGVTGVSIQRAYADWAIPQHRNLRNSVLQVGIEPVQIFNTNQNDKVKNAADVSLIIDAVDLAARNPEITNFVIASGDGIFAFLSKKLHERGKRVIGCSFEKIANTIFRNSCDYFIGLEKADKAIIATPLTKTAPTTPTPEKRNKPAKKTNLPKTKYTEILLASSIEPPQDAGDASGVMHMACQMVNALFSDAPQDLTGLEISIFANYITHYLPNFRVKSFKFRGIAEFLRFILTGSDYCIYSVNDNVVLMGTRAMAEAAGGTVVVDVKGLLIATQDGERYNSVFNVPVGTPFVYSVTKDEVKPKRKYERRAAKPATEPAQEIHEPAELEHSEAPIETETPEVSDSPTKDDFRKAVKAHFEALSRTNALSIQTVRKLQKEKYPTDTFGVRAPILIKITAKSDIAALRLINGKVKYWKELFEFQGNKYLVFKEWVSIHRARFNKWATMHKPR